MDESLKRKAVEFINELRVCSLSTVNDGAAWSRVMSTSRVEDDLTLWYASFASSDKVRQIRAEPRVCIVYYKPGMDIRIFGQAQVLTDQVTKDGLWKEEMLMYFKGGKTDPEYVAIRVTPTSVELRDVAHGDFNPVELIAPSDSAH